MPVLLNVLVIITVAILFNYPFAWRRYPAFLKKEPSKEKQTVKAPIAHEDLVYALSEVDSFVDISEQDLLSIYNLATRRSQENHLAPEALQLGRYYSNGKYGEEWTVRQIIDQPDGSDPGDDLLIFKVVAGAGRRSTGVSTREEFARWAKHEVYREDENWRRVEG
jgi:hypothetical protein